MVRNPVLTTMIIVAAATAAVDVAAAQSAQTAVDHPSATAAKRDTRGSDTVTGRPEGQHLRPTNPVGTTRAAPGVGPAARDAR